MNTTNTTPLFNIDSALSPLSDDEISASLIEARISMLAFKNFDFMEKRLPFVLELCTSSESNWSKLIGIAPQRYWIRGLGIGVLVFNAGQDCGYLRTYRLRANSRAAQEKFADATWTQLKDEETLYAMLDTLGAKVVFNAWVDHKTRVTDLPTELVTGRLGNTSVEKAMIFSKGEGCVVCGAVAKCYAATTLGTSDAAVMIQMPVCAEHLEAAKAHPTIFSFLGSLFQLSLDWPELVKHDAIPDGLIPTVHALVATELGGQIGSAEKRRRGWHLWLLLPSGWRWLLRLNSLNDYAYMLFEPGRRPERYRADSAPDHADVPFFPMHQHSHPDNDADNVTPSFLYGHPLFDLKRLKAAGRHYGAY